MPEKSFKQSVTTVPVLGYLIRLFSNIMRLPKIRDDLAKEQANTNNILSKLQKEQTEMLTKQSIELGELSDKLTSTRLNQDNLQREFSVLETSQSTNTDKPTGNQQQRKQLLADDHILDKFYIDFEDRHRGPEQMITKRQEEYLPYFQNTKLDFKKTPVLDIGSGRGELLQLLKKYKIYAIGLDINHDMVERSKKKGLEAVQGDAFKYLQEAKSQSYGVITGFHIVEHIPFNLLLRIFENAHRALAENGFVIFETPNPENIIVGSCAFYMDPSHLHPLPPDLLSFTLEICGFRKVEIIRLHPVNGQDTKGLPTEVASRFFGPRDYAVIGYK